jgi:hypothetical protein
MENLTSIPIADLQKIEELYRNNDKTLPNFLKEVIDKYGFDFKGWILTSSYGCIFENFENIMGLFPALAEVNEEIMAIKNGDLFYMDKHFKAFQVISNALNISGGRLIATLIPEGGSDRSYLCLADSHLITPIILLYHFNETMNIAPNYASFNEYIQIYDVSYEDFIAANGFPGKTNIIDVVEYTVEESPYGSASNFYRNNLGVLNIDKEIYNVALVGMKSVKAFVN